MLNQRNRQIINEHYAMVPKSHVPRATFHRPYQHITTMTPGWLIPGAWDEVLPGDVHTVHVNAFVRPETFTAPLMANATIEWQAFFIPMRLTWKHTREFFGEQKNPGDSTSYLVPQVTINKASLTPNSIYDYIGLPLAGQIVPATYSVNALIFRAYYLTFNEWYRDQNLQNSFVTPDDDGPDSDIYVLAPRNSKHDYFTSGLPQPQKGTAVNIALTGNAPITGIGVSAPLTYNGPGTWYETEKGAVSYAGYVRADGADPSGVNVGVKIDTVGPDGFPLIYADLSQATGTQIANLRFGVQLQKIFEADARHGTRYTEQLRGRWGITPQDARLQRPEYLGGGIIPMQTMAMAQTNATDVTGSTTPLGSLAGQATLSGGGHFTCIGHEHGYFLVLFSIMTKRTYQNGVHRGLTRQSRFDFAMPEFAALGEQPIRNDELWADGTAADSQPFAYQERYGEYRFSNNRISGMMRSDAPGGSLDYWHLAPKYASRPTLSSQFIKETTNAPWGRVFAAGDDALPIGFKVDLEIDVTSTRPLPAYGIPGGLPGTF